MSGFNARTEPGTWTEYGVRYDAYPSGVVVPFVTTVTAERWLAESVARRESREPGIECTLVERQVSSGEWRVAS